MRPLGLKPRTAQTLAGPVRFEREVFECPRCRRANAPLDAALGLLPGQKMTHALRRAVAWAGARDSFAGASADLRELRGVAVSPAECARVAAEEGQRLGRLQAQREQAYLAPVVEIGQAVPAPEIACRRLVVEADATTVLTVPGEEHKAVWCAKAFGLEHRARKDGSQRPVIGTARQSASGQDFEVFGPKVRALALRMGLRKAQAVAFIADGAPALWRWAEHNLPAGTVLIQDLWHVLEHLSELAKDLLGQDAPAAFARWRTLVAGSRVGEVLAELEAEHTRRRGAPRQRLFEEIRYLRNGQSRMDYARYEREGWPLGSGAIEGCCKHLIKERFGRTGARWRRKNIDPMAALRLSIANEEWEHDWTHELPIAA